MIKENILDIKNLKRVSSDCIEHPDPALKRDVELLDIQIYILEDTKYFIMCQHDEDGSLQYGWYENYESEELDGKLIPSRTLTLEEILESDVDPEKLEGLLYHLDLLS